MATNISAHRLDPFPSPKRTPRVTSASSAEQNEIDGEGDSDNDDNDDGSASDDGSLSDGSESGYIVLADPPPELHEPEDLGLSVSDGEGVGMLPGDDENSALVHYLGMKHFVDAESDHVFGSRSEDDSDTDAGSSPGRQGEQDEHSNDSSIEREEEQAILCELKDPRAENDDEVHDGCDSSSFSDSKELSDCDVYDLFESTTPCRRLTDTSDVREVGSDDDMMWALLFTSSEEQEDEPDVFLEVQPENYSSQLSGDSTDEDENIPKGVKRASKTRALEVLSSSNLSTRPPVLGSWYISNSNKNFGIIDGLTTSTLCPVAQKAGSGNSSNSCKVGNSSNSLGCDPKNGSACHRIYESGLHSDSDRSDLEFDEFIKTEELSDDSQPADESSTFIYQNTAVKNVPLSAFRYKSSPYPANDSGVFYHNRRVRRRLMTAREVTTPSRPLRKRPKKFRPTYKRDKEVDLPITESKPKDLIEELIEVGAISPLFEF